MSYSRNAARTLIRWSIETLGRAVPAGISVLALHGIFGLVHWYTWTAYGVIGIALSFCGWGGEWVWQVTIGHMVRRPNPYKRALTKIPFWYIAGGIGYVIGMLASKKMFLLGFYDIPIKPLFLLGGLLGCVLQLLLEFTKTRWRTAVMNASQSSPFLKT